MMADPLVVIGAGVGGLSAAIRLAAAGRRVVVLEQNEAPGGKMGEVAAAGFRWDTGPSVITMRHVLEDLFASAGRRLDDYLTLLPVEPLTRYFFADGVKFDATRQLDAMLAQVAGLDERDIEGYLAYLAYAARLHRVTGPVFIYDRPPTWRSFLAVSPGDALATDPLRTMAAKIGHFVTSPHLRQLLARFATYAGSDPYQASATLNVIAHVELAGGVWYPQGGVYAIARALARLAAEMGVEVHTGAKVRSIDVRSGRVAGVTLQDGRIVPAGAVVCNVDVGTVYRDLLPDGAVSTSRRQAVARFDPSCSGFVLLLGVEGLHPDLAHHNIFFSGAYRDEFDAIFRRGVPPDDPTIYVAITARTDPDHALPGTENWFVLVNAPPLGNAFDWTTQASAYRDLVLARLAARGYDVRSRLRFERILTPLDLERQTGAWRGALYGMSMNHRLAPFRRPHNRCPDVRGLFFAGGATHPGGGVPMVMLSARIAATMALNDV